MPYLSLIRNHPWLVTLTLLKCLGPAFGAALVAGLFGIVASTIHEAGHLGAAILLRVKVKKVGVCWRGLYCVREKSPNPTKNILITSAGPLINLATVGVWHWFPVLAWASLFVGLFNLLPLAHADGARLLSYIHELNATPSKPPKDGHADMRGSVAVMTGASPVARSR